MVARNPRYMVTVPKETASILCLQSRNKEISVSKLILDLIEEALEIREDMELSKIADEAWERNKDKPRIPAAEVYKLCGLI